MSEASEEGASRVHPGDRFRRGFWSWSWCELGAHGNKRGRGVVGRIRPPPSPLLQYYLVELDPLL